MPDFSRLDVAPLHSACVLLVFRLSDRLAAFRMEDVERVTPMAELASPPGMAPALEGFLNLSGVAIPVLRLDRLFHLPTQTLALYSMLVILKTIQKERIAVLVDRVSEILSVAENSLVPLEQDDSFNGCAEATVRVREDVVHLLSPAKVLLAKESAALSEFQALAQRRLQEWEAVQA